ncbi:Metallo-beta-lactamase superfamily protein [Palleronia marisminoris]|nr:Metallo-beta-lactamase superfamily protein [Palleronia marisminoris]
MIGYRLICRPRAPALRNETFPMSTRTDRPPARCAPNLSASFSRKEQIDEHKKSATTGRAPFGLKGSGSPDVWGIYEPDTGPIQYICADPADPATKKAALTGVWNFDPKNYRFSTESMDQVLNLVQENGLTVEWVLDTHPHADHVMALAHLKKRTGAPNAIGDKVPDIADLWEEI